MTRTFYTLSAFVVSCGILSGVAAMPIEVSPPKPAMIGAEHPIFLGRMVVTATPLPEEGRR